MAIQQILVYIGQSNSFIDIRKVKVCGWIGQRAFGDSRSRDLSHWFELYQTTVQQYNIKLENRYNMDEKGVMMGYIGKVKVIISKYDKKIYMT
jgi:hypothetical protein